MSDQRNLSDLHSVGPSTIRDLELLGITSVPALARSYPHELYALLCVRTGVRHDPCCEDVFCAAVAQAKDPNLPLEQARWWYWSRQRKANSPNRATRV